MLLLDKIKLNRIFKLCPKAKLDYDAAMKIVNSFKEKNIKVSRKELYQFDVFSKVIYDNEYGGYDHCILFDYDEDEYQIIPCKDMPVHPFLQCFEDIHEKCYEYYIKKYSILIKEKSKIDEYIISSNEEKISYILDCFLDVIYEKKVLLIDSTYYSSSEIIFLGSEYLKRFLLDDYYFSYPELESNIEYIQKNLKYIVSKKG